MKYRFGTEGRLNINLMMEDDGVRIDSDPIQDCWYCGSQAEAIDHLHPRKLGGDNKSSNLIPVCKSCNSSKNAKPLEDWRKFIEKKISNKIPVTFIFWFEMQEWKPQ